MSPEETAAWDELLSLGVSEQTLQIVTSINGLSIDTLRDVLYAHTGYRSFDQVADDDEDDYDPVSDLIEDGAEIVSESRSVDTVDPL